MRFFLLLLNCTNWLKKQFQTKIINFQSNWGGEFRTVNTYLKENGIQHRITCSHIHQQNGQVERKIRHLVDTCLTLLAHSAVPSRFWNFAMHTTAYLINRLPTQVLQHVSPFEKLHGTSPDYEFRCLFGCTVYPLLRPYNQHKFSYRTATCVFLGYA